MSLATTPIEHPLVRAVEGVAECLDQAVGANPVFLTTDQKETVLTGLAREKARLEALEHRVLAAADDVAAEHGARIAGAWLAHATRQDGPVGRRWQRLADGLDGRWPVLATAYAAGSASTAQAQVVGRALDALPADLDPDLRTRAEEHLVAQCAHFTPRQLTVLGRRVLEVVAPEVAEAHDARLVDAEEQHAWDHATLTWHRCGNGMSRATAVLPDAVMDRWLTHLHAFSSPRREGPVAPDDRRPHPTRLAHAFAALLERIPEDWLPQHGGTTTSLLVTIDAEKLTQDLATAGLATGSPITAGEARRLACTAGILPAVLDAKSQPLDLGRTKRLSRPASARRWPSATGSAAPRAATSPPPGAKPTTSPPGASTAGPTSPTASCSARSTTTAPTTPATTGPSSPTATTASTGGREPRPRTTPTAHADGRSADPQQCVGGGRRPDFDPGLRFELEAIDRQQLLTG